MRRRNGASKPAQVGAAARALVAGGALASFIVLRRPHAPPNRRVDGNDQHDEPRHTRRRRERDGAGDGGDGDGDGDTRRHRQRQRPRHSAVHVIVTATASRRRATPPAYHAAVTAPAPPEPAYPRPSPLPRPPQREPRWHRCLVRRTQVTAPNPAGVTPPRTRRRKTMIHRISRVLLLASATLLASTVRR